MIWNLQWKERIFVDMLIILFSKSKPIFYCVIIRKCNGVQNLSTTFSKISSFENKLSINEYNELMDLWNSKSENSRVCICQGICQSFGICQVILIKFEIKKKGRLNNLQVNMRL